MKTLVLDFDGVLNSYTKWEGPGVINDVPVPGAMAFLWGALKRFDVCIFSSRSAIPEGKTAMQEWLQKYMIAWIHFGNMPGHTEAEALERLAKIRWPDTKPPAHLTLDDRAWCFNGTWPDLDDIEAFVPWNRNPAAVTLRGRRTGPDEFPELEGRIGPDEAAIMISREDALAALGRVGQDAAPDVSALRQVYAVHSADHPEAARVFATEVQALSLALHEANNQLVRAGAQGARQFVTVQAQDVTGGYVYGEGGCRAGAMCVQDESSELKAEPPEDGEADDGEHEAQFRHQTAVLDSKLADLMVQAVKDAISELKPGILAAEAKVSIPPLTAEDKSERVLRLKLERGGLGSMMQTRMNTCCDNCTHADLELRVCRNQAVYSAPHAGQPCEGHEGVEGKRVYRITLSPDGGLRWFKSNEKLRTEYDAALRVLGERSCAPGPMLYGLAVECASAGEDAYRAECAAHGFPAWDELHVLQQTEWHARAVSEGEADAKG